MRIIPASDSSLLVVFGDAISPEIHKQVIALFHAIEAAADARITNVHPGYASVLVDFNPLQCGHDEMGKVLRSMVLHQVKVEVTGAEVTIPVCYGGEFGPDLEDVAKANQVSVDEVVRLHSSAEYLVYFLGFSPGFAYLGGLPKELHTPRLPRPRSRVPTGAVGIAGAQTGVYPVQSPGGWRLIGRTPVPMLGGSAGRPTRLEPGDRVKFVAISRTAFDAIASKQAKG